MWTRLLAVSVLAVVAAVPGPARPEAPGPDPVPVQISRKMPPDPPEPPKPKKRSGPAGEGSSLLAVA